MDLQGIANCDFCRQASGQIRRRNGAPQMKSARNEAAGAEDQH